MILVLHPVFCCCCCCFSKAIILFLNFVFADVHPLERSLSNHSPEVISQNLQENTFARVFFNKAAGGACNFIKKETLAQVFSCEICEIFKNSNFGEHLRIASASDSRLIQTSFRDVCMTLSNIHDGVFLVPL